MGFFHNYQNKYLHLNPLNTLATINRNMMFSKNLSKDDKKLAYAKQVLLNKIVFSENRKSSLNTITIDVKKYPSLAQQIIENIYLSLLTYSNEITSTKAKEKIIFISGRINQVKFDLNSSEQEMISFMEKNKNFSSSPSLLVEKDRIQRNINLYNSLYLSLSDQFELAKIDASVTSAPKNIEALISATPAGSFLISESAQALELLPQGLLPGDDTPGSG